MNTYEINVAQRGAHVCRVKINASYTEAEAVVFFNDFCSRFPQAEGFGCDLYRVPVASSYLMKMQGIDTNEPLKSV